MRYLHTVFEIIWEISFPPPIFYYILISLQWMSFKNKRFGDLLCPAQCFRNCIWPIMQCGTKWIFSVSERWTNQATQDPLVPLHMGTGRCQTAAGDFLPRVTKQRKDFTRPEGGPSAPDWITIILTSNFLQGLAFVSCSLSFLKLFYVEVELIYNVVLVSGVKQSDSVIHISILFQILFPFRLLQNIE